MKKILSLLLITMLIIGNVSMIFAEDVDNNEPEDPPVQEPTDEPDPVDNYATSSQADQISNQVENVQNDVTEIQINNNELHYEINVLSDEVRSLRAGDSIDNYIQVEYIENTGEAYINTGDYYHADYRYYFDYKLNEVTSYYACGWGNSYSRWNMSSNGTNFQVGIAGSFYTSATLNTYLKNTNRHTLIIRNKYIKADNNSDIDTGFNPTNDSQQRDLLLFSAINASDYQTYYKMRVYRYYVRVYSTSTDVQDMIPVIQKSTGIYGLYDRINNIFYPSIGTDQFTGPAVTDTFTVTTSTSPQGAGTITGGGTYTYGDTCNLYVSSASGYSFTGWYDSNNNLLSSNRNYSFTVRDDTTIIAHFNQSGGGGSGDYTDQLNLIILLVSFLIVIQICRGGLYD